jgi:2'-5' RNA ligase
MFCAVAIPERVRARFAEYVQRLRDQAPEVRASWEGASNLHLTLKFIGEIDESRVEQLSLAAARAAVKLHPFELTIEGAGAFPKHGAPRVLWLGIGDQSGALARLQRKLEDECDQGGFEREKRGFNPHLTVARLRTPVGARKLAELHRKAGFGLEKFCVDEVVIMRSELGPRGATHTAISRHRLGP